jgi:DNA-binding transcriptional LysR family regulator
MELRHLRYFVAVAEELNFTRAAGRLHIGQPPLSMQIRDLEAEIGARLLERSKRRVALTEAGKAFLERARAILAQAALAGEEARRAARGERGLLRIGFTTSLPYSPILPDVLLAYRRRYPEVALQLSEMFTADQLAAVAGEQIDIGFVRYVGGPLPRGVGVREIGQDALRIVINAAHRLARRRRVGLVELAGEDFITFPPGVGTGLPAILQRLCRDAGFEPRIVQTAREAMTQIGLVAAGLGIALLPAPLECVQLPRVRYLPVTDAGAVFPLSVAMRAGAPGPLLAGLLEVLDAVRAADGGQAR